MPSGLSEALCVSFVPHGIFAWSGEVVVWLITVAGLVQLLAQNLLVGRFQFSFSNGVDANL